MQIKIKSELKKMKNKAILVISLSLILILTACEDEHDHDHDKNHFSPEGMVLLLKDTVKILDYFRGVVKDTLYVPFGNYTPYYTVKFYDANKNIIDPPDEANHYLSWTISNENIFSVEKQMGQKYIIRLKGNSVGITTVKFMVMHGSHADFQTRDIPVVVR